MNSYSTVTILSNTASSSAGVYPLDIERDLPEVVRLIEVGFAEELDPQGWAMLRQMQELARRPSWWLRQNAHEVQLNGFVWREGGHVIGNASLRRAAPWSNGGWMIGNVVVDKAYRGRGIGRALMQACLLDARRKGGSWVGLEVRSNNEPARTLYEHLGFTAVGEVIHWLHPGQPRLARPSHVERKKWRAARADDASHWYTLACALYPSPQRDVLEIRVQQYRYGGLEHALMLWLDGQHEWAWLENTNHPRLGVYVRKDWRYRYYLWNLLIHPACGDADVQATLERALNAPRRWEAWPSIIYTRPHDPLNRYLEDLGFGEHRRLTQMLYPLGESTYTIEVKYAER